jgi:hypothetical protein
MAHVPEVLKFAFVGVIVLSGLGGCVSSASSTRRVIGVIKIAFFIIMALSGFIAIWIRKRTENQNSAFGSWLFLKATMFAFWMVIILHYLQGCFEPRDDW